MEEPSIIKAHRRRVLLIALVPIAVVLLLILLFGWFRFISNDADDSAGLIENEQPITEISLEELRSLDPQTELKINNANQLVVNGELKANRAFVIAPGTEPADPTAGQLFYDIDLNRFRYYDGQDFLTIPVVVDEQEICFVGSDCGFLTAADLPSGLTLPQPLGVGDSPTFAGLTVTNDLNVSSGGTGRSSFTNNALLIGNGSGDIGVTNAPTTGQIIVADGSGRPRFVGMGGDATINSSGLLILTVDSVDSNELASTGVTAGVYGNGSNYPVITVDEDGRVTDVSTQAIGGGGAGVTALNTLAGALTIQGTTNQIIINDNGSSTITLSLPQDIAASSTPAFAGLNLSANLDVNGSTTLGDALADQLTINGTIQGGSPFVFEGATADGFQTTFVITDPTAARTIAFPNLSGTVCLNSGNCSAAGAAGGDLDGNYPNPTVVGLNGTSLNTSGLAGGDVLLFSGTEWVNEQITGDISISNLGLAVIQPGSVELGADTTGNYLATLSSGVGTGISVTNGSGEGAATSISLMACNNGEILKYNAGAWSCDTDAGSGGGGVDSLNDLEGALTLQGTTNQIVITDDDTDTITLALPQDIATTSAVTFGGLTVNGTMLANGNMTLGDTGTDTLTINATLQGANPLVFEGTTIDANQITLSIQDPTADITYRLANAAAGVYDICTTAGNCLGAGGGSAPADAQYVTLGLNGNLTNERVLTQGTNISIVDGGANGNITVNVVNNPTFSGLVSANGGLTATGAVSLGGAQLIGGSPLVFEGATINAFQTTLAVEDPTGNRVITLPDESGEVCLDSGNCVGVGGSAPFDAQYLVLSLDGNLSAERLLVAGAGLASADGGANGNLTLSVNVDGSTIAVNGDTLEVPAGGITTTQIDDGTITGDDIAADAVALGGQTTGNYLATLSSGVGTGISVTNGTGEGAAASISLMACNDDEILKYNSGAWACDTDAGSGGGGVDSLNSLEGALTLQGTTNQIVITDNSSDTITLSLPQDIAITSAVTFGGLTVNGTMLANGNMTIGDAGTDTLTINATLQGANPLVFEGLTVDGNTLTFSITNPTSNQVITFPDETGTVCLTSGNCIGGGGGGGAPSNAQYLTLALSGDLSAERLLQGGNGIDLTDGGANGNATFNLAALTNNWNQTGAFDIILGHANSELLIMESVGDTYFATLDSGDLSANRTFTLGDNGGEICTTAGNCIGGGASGGAPADGQYLTLALNANLSAERVLSAGSNIDFVDAGANGNFTVSVVNNPTFSGLITANGGLTVETGDTFTFNGDGFTDLAGTGLTVSGGALQTTLGTDVDLATEVTGILPVTNGGTGAGTFSQYGLLYGNGTSAFGVVAPGTNGQCLTANTGAAPTWTNCGGGSLFTDAGTFTYLNSTTDDLILGGTTVGAADIFLGDDGSAVFNEQGNNADFRIEGDTRQNLFFVDASADMVGIGLSGPTALLDITGIQSGGSSLRLRSGYADGGGDANQILLSWNGTTSYTHSIRSIHNIGGANNNAIQFYIWDATGGVADMPTNNVFNISGNNTGSIGVNTSANPIATLTVNNKLSTADIVQIQDDGVSVFTIQDGGTAIFNDGGLATADLRVEGDTNANLLFVDASADSVAIGHSTPSAWLDVTGAESSSNSLRLRGGYAAALDGNQILFSYSGSELYTHLLRTRHNAGTVAGNAIQFYVWDSTAGGNMATNNVFNISANNTGSIGVNTTFNPVATLTVNNKTSTANIVQIQDNGTAVFTIADGGAVTASAGNLTLGTTSQLGTLNLFDGSSHTAGITTANQTGNRTYTIPTTTGNDTFCLVTLANCAGTSLWTDAGTFTYLNSTTDDLILGGTTVGAADIFLGDDGSAVFNEQGNNADFRIEGDTQQSLFFVDASADFIGVKTNTPSAVLDISTTGDALRLRSGNINTGGANNQILLSYAGGVNYTHAIKSRHSDSSASRNAIDFYVWQQGVDPAGTIGTNQVFTIDGGNFGSIGVNTESNVLTANLVVNNQTSTADIVQVQDNGSTIFAIADGGAVSLGNNSTAALLRLFDGSNHTATLQTANQTANRTFTIPTSADDTICLLNLANCTGGAVSGSGSAGRVAFWNGTSTIASNANLLWNNTDSRLGVGASTLYSRFTSQNFYSSGTQANVSNNLNNAAINIQGDFSPGHTYTGAMLWSTSDHNPTIPKAGIYTSNNDMGGYTSLILGTSNDWDSGITSHVVINKDGEFEGGLTVDKFYSTNTKTDMTNTVANSSLHIQGDWSAGTRYLGGIHWSTSDFNPTLPKGAIYLRTDDVTGQSSLILGTTNNWANGITSEVVINGHGELEGGLTVRDMYSSGTETDVNDNLDNAVLNLKTNKGPNDSYTGAIIWSTPNHNATKPKAAIYVKNEDFFTVGSQLIFGTSNTYANGITSKMIMDQNANLFVQGSRVEIGTASQLGALRLFDGTSHYASITTANQTANRTFTIPITSGNDTFCLVTLANCSGAGASSIGTIDSQTKSNNGAVITGNSLVMQTADQNFPGLVSTGTQTFAGAKTFSGNFIANASVDLGDASTDTITFVGQVDSDIIPASDDTYDLGSSTNRWQDLYLGPASLHIGTDGDEGVLGYNTTTDQFEFNQSINVQSAATTTDGLAVTANNLSTGNALSVTSASGDITSGDLVNISSTGEYSSGNPLSGSLLKVNRNILSNDSTTAGVTLDNNVSTHSTSSASSIHTFSHSVSAQPNQVLIVMTAGGRNPSTPAPTSISFDGLPLTHYTATNGNSGQVETSIWYLVDPPETTANVIVTYPQSVYGVWHASNFYNVDQGNPIDGGQGSTSLTLNIDSEVGDLVIDNIGSIAGANEVPGAGQTEFVDTNANVYAAASYESGTTPTVTMSWTGIGGWPSHSAANLNGVETSGLQIISAAVDISSQCTDGSGTCTDTASVLQLTQNTSGATGNVLQVTSAGAGWLGNFSATNALSNGVAIDLQSSSSDQTAFLVTSNNGATTGLSVLGDGKVGIGTAAPDAQVDIQNLDADSIGLLVRAAAAQVASLFQLQDSDGNVHAAFNETGAELTLGRIADSGTVSQGKLTLADGTTSNYAMTLQSAFLTDNRTHLLPDIDGTLTVTLGGGGGGQANFGFTGEEQTWVVPAGVQQIYVEVAGASGAPGQGGSTGTGAIVKHTIDVTPGETFYIYVGSNGTTTGVGGWNGGGGTVGGSAGRAGGGASDIRFGGNTLADRIIVAGGGGGGTRGCPYRGGHGGVPDGERGENSGGFGGTQLTGGAPSGNGAPTAGTLGQGGLGELDGGGGGGGYYGGGGGGGYFGCSDRAGGGGSSLVPEGGTVDIGNIGYGYINITWLGSGAANVLPVFGNNNSLLDSHISQNIDTVFVSADLRVTSGNTGDAVLSVIADADNNDENDNPRIDLIQDGGTVSTSIGMIGEAEQLFTSSLANAAYINNNYSGGAVQFAANGAARMTILPDGRIGMGISAPDTSLHVYSGSNPTLKIQSDGTDEESGRVSLRQSNNTGADIVYNGSNSVDAFQIQTFNAGTLSATPMSVLLNGNVTFNEPGIDADFRIEGVGSANAFFVQGSDGFVGIGDATPAAMLTVGDGDLFQVNSTGAIQAATGITSSGTITFSGLTSCTSIQTNGSGVLSCGGGGAGSSDTPYILVAADNSSATAKAMADYVADGTSDEDEINSALTAAAGGKVVLAEGTYVADGTILIPNNTTLEGYGPGTVIELADLDATEYLVEATGTNRTGQIIKDLKLDGRSDLNTAGIQRGIYFDSVGDTAANRPGATVIGVTVTRFITHGIYLNSSSNSTVTGNNANNNGMGIIINLGSNNTITDNNSSNNNRGIYLGSSHSNTIADNIVSNNTTEGIWLNSSSSNNTISGNSITSNSQGIAVNSFSDSNTITGNILNDNGTGIILTSSSNNNAITGNNIHDSGYSTNNEGIYIGSSDFNSIFNNHITDTSCTTTCYAINITSSASDKNYLEGNRFSGSTTDAASINDLGTNTIYVNQQTNSTTSTNNDVTDFRFRGSANSTTAFAVQNASGASVFNVNTTIGQVDINGSVADGTPVLALHTSATSGDLIGGFNMNGNKVIEIDTTGGEAGEIEVLNNALTTWVKMKPGGADEKFEIRVHEAVADDALALFNSNDNRNSGLKLREGGSDAAPGVNGMNIIYAGNTNELTVQTVDSTNGTDNVFTIARSDGAALFRTHIDSTTGFQVQDANGGAPILNVDTTNERLGVGTAAPGVLLDVDSETSSSDVNIFRVVTDVGGDENVKFRIDSDGDVFSDGTNNLGGGADVAERYQNFDGAQAGEVVVFQDNRTVKKSNSAYQTAIAGVVSTKAGLILDANVSGVPVALAGRVPVKVTNENGAIQRGDYLTSSATKPGYAMKATSSGATIGMAMENFNSATGVIDLWVNTGHYTPNNLQANPTFSSINVTGTINAVNLTVTGTANIATANITDLKVTGTTEVAKLVVNGHIITAGDEPTINAGEAAGTGAEAEVEGTDVAGSVKVTTGQITTSGVLAAIDFNEAYGETPRVTLTPTNANAALSQFYVERTKDQFIIKVITSLDENIELMFDYQVIQ